MALVQFDTLADADAKAADCRADPLLSADRTDYFVDQLFARARSYRRCLYPKPVIIRMSDFKTNEYANLLGGAGVRAQGGEPDARLPRRLALLLAPLPRRLRPGMPGDQASAGGARGFTNVVVMIPFCRTLAEADRVLR